MWDLLELIVEQLGTTLKWGFIGFVIGLLFIWLLRKGDLLKYNSFWQVLRTSIYYIFYPIGFGCLFWFYTATKQVEVDAYQATNEAINKTEEGLFPLFEEYIIQNLPSYISYNHIPSNDQVVKDFLNENDKSSWIKTKIVHWGLVKSLETFERKALKQMGISENETNLTIKALNNSNLSINKAIFDLPFSSLKGMTFNLVKDYIKQFYSIYLSVFGCLILVIMIDLGYSHLKKYINI